ncbi:MAG: hypothetical protein ACYSSI_13150 [Planctomycetota bacterium]
MRTITILSAGIIIFIAAGCQNTESLKSHNAGLLQQETLLKKQIEKTQTENKQLKKQLNVLAGLKPQIKSEDIYNLQRIKIGRYTNFYDKDKDGKKEKLIVYLQPIDEFGDLIKAAGSVDVQLWDLNKENGKALIGKWHVKPQELKKLWFATILTNYRLTFDVSDKMDVLQSPLTVKVTFTDYLSGKVFKEQKAIKF